MRLALTGSLTVTDKAALDACLDKYARLFAALGLWERQTDIAVIPADGEFDDLGIGGFAAAAVEELVDHGPLRRRGRRRTPRRRWRCCCGCARQPDGVRVGMKLHRLVLTNYRGITHREIEFPDHGVVVVSGANEIGKSSMIEALDLLLEAKDRSTKKEVKQVKPTHADVGAEITAEISTGPYRFVYRKRFHKRARHELTVLAPRREQLTGDEAHDRVRAIAATKPSTPQLWQAQRVLQAASTAAVDLSGCDALSRALDVAAGEAVAAVRGRAAADRPDRRRVPAATSRRPAARPANGPPRRTGMTDADDEVARCAAAVAEVDDAVRTHATLTAELERAHGRAGGGGQAAGRRANGRRRGRRADPTAQAGRGGRRGRRCDARSLRLGTDRAAQAAGRRRRAHRGRRRTGNRCGRSPRGGADRTGGAGGRRSGRRRGARHRFRPARTASTPAAALVGQLSDRDEADRLSSRLAKIDAAQSEVERVDRELASIALTDAAMRDIETAAAAVERAAGQAELASAHIEVVAVGDVDLRIGRRIGHAWTAGGTWSANATTTDRDRRAGRADRARGARCARGGHPGQTRCRTTGSGGGTDGCPGRRRRGERASSTNVGENW